MKAPVPSLPSSVPAATAASGHFGEWRAIDEKARFSASGERLGDISKCVMLASICYPLLVFIFAN